MKLIQVKVSDDFHEQVQAKSQSTGVSVAYIVRRALEDWVNGPPPVLFDAALIESEALTMPRAEMAERVAAHTKRVIEGDSKENGSKREWKGPIQKPGEKR